MPGTKLSLRTLLLFVLITSLIGVSPFPIQADAFNWSAANIPAEGVGGNWVLAAGSDICCLTRASDGTLYCYASPAGTPYRLFKSTDGGCGWFYTGKVSEVIVDIAVMPGNPDLVFYATDSKVYQSGDGGATFTALADNPGGAGTGGVTITDIHAAQAEGTNYLVIATRDNDLGEYGGVYLLAGSGPGVPVDTGLAGLDIYAAVFSPGFATDRQITAVGSDETDTVISTRFGDREWGAGVGDARVTGLPLESAALAFPDDYCSDPSLDRYTQFIAVNSGSGRGDIYRLEGRSVPLASGITDLDAGSGSGMEQVDITGLAVCGNIDDCSILAGAGSAAAVYYSADAGDHWLTSSKPPSGESDTCVFAAPDFAFTGTAYAVTRGTESAFSISRDGGRTWNQTSLVDTRITSILDLAVSPAFNHDNTLLLLTADLQNSLWRSSSGGLRWERVFHSSPAALERASLVLVSPEYAVNKIIFLAGSSQGSPVIWKSADNGSSFIKYYSIDPWTDGPVGIDAWTVAPGDVLYVAGFDGDHGLVYQTAAGSLDYIDKAQAGTHSLNSVIISPEFNTDHAVLAGSTAGSIFYSHDGGRVFEALPFGSTQASLDGTVAVAFDSGFSQNKTVYAAGSAANEGIHRFVIGESYDWEPVDSTLPVGAKIGQLVSSNGGPLYAVNTQAVNNSQCKGGLERSINPAAQTPVFETVTSGLADGIILKMLRVQGSSLWTVDAVNARLLTCTDTLASLVDLVTPADLTTGLDTRGVKIAWEALSGAAGYHWQVDTDRNFSVIPSGLEGHTDSLFHNLPALDPDTTYYWRVRADRPVAGPWSAVWSFSIRESSNTPPVFPPISPTITGSPLAVPDLAEPRSTSPVSINPVFRWSATGADRYVLLVSGDDAFSGLVIDKNGDNSCHSNVWKCDIDLEYGATYYWKVKAVYGFQVSEWSEVGVFTTENDPDALPDSLPVPRLREPGINDICSVQPVFQWTACQGAERYEILVSKDDSFTNPVIDKTGDKACYSNIWQCDAVLDYGSGYYWKVRAAAGDLTGGWSDVGLFTTRINNSTPSPSSPSVTPAGGPDKTSTLDGTATPTPSIPAAGSGASPTLTEGPAPGSPTAGISQPPVTDSPGSTVRLLFFLVGGLAVLTAVLIVVVVVMLRKFRQY